jgi:hypothetical protein
MSGMDKRRRPRGRDQFEVPSSGSSVPHKVETMPPQNVDQDVDEEEWQMMERDNGDAWDKFRRHLGDCGLDEGEIDEACNIIGDGFRRRRANGRDAFPQRDNRSPSPVGRARGAMDAIPRLLRRIQVEPDNNPAKLARMAMDRHVTMTGEEQRRMHAMFPGLARIGQA